MLLYLIRYLGIPYFVLFVKPDLLGKYYLKEIPSTFCGRYNKMTLTIHEIENLKHL